MNLGWEMEVKNTRNIDWSEWKRLATFEDVVKWCDGIDPSEVSAMVRDAYENGECEIVQQFGEEDDILYTVAKVREQFFYRDRISYEPSVIRWGMNLGKWSDPPYYITLVVGDEGDDILDKVVIDDQLEEVRESYGKWWRRESGKTQN